MRYLAVATDYDGTLAQHGTVAPETVEALRRLAATGRKLILVTGRQLDDLHAVFPEVSMFDHVVAENGGVLYRPQQGTSRTLADPPSRELLDALKRHGVNPLFVGKVVVATVQPNDIPASDVIRELGLELEIILNKGSVMILPSGVDKATGLQAALQELKLSAGNVVGIGDAENDEALLAVCGLGVAVDNAVESLKRRTSLVTKGHHGAGVEEMVAALLNDTLP